MNLTTDHWQYLLSAPNATGTLKSSPDDFIVKEELGYQPIGEGEHIYLWIEKNELNTAFVAEAIAKYAQLPLRAVSYAGRKDKHAKTYQWIGVHKPGKEDIDWQGLHLDGLQILEAKRHNKKLRTGVLKGNHFTITLRDIKNAEDLPDRIAKITQTGVPNYFGEQRFGSSRHHPQGGNLALAEMMMGGETIRNRNKRSMAISALRSWLFNEFVSKRLEHGIFDTVLEGDAMQLSGSNSFFTADVVDEHLLSRVEQRDVIVTAPMWGEGPLQSKEAAKDFETQCAGSYSDLTNTLEALKLSQERRAIRLYASNLDFTLADDTLTISFSLPSGAFATSVLRELITTQSGDRE
ncbi:tRNA pseudouridine(13) synthase TruD [Aestuariibacter sp. AA17]|uniref:tRNA pseudouridine synthase D n=1 Tax=Fluctibacter corallii TaxID=2984329 RepID=A0ABT3A7S0_9ALTE|nr:tRNA pseudouridine(13) synthase TruD [Aestuariibacter sp. AA17]MCV2884619.1 tRNA pseudouridine(13) synthase TruD [Aestuariibacter sp. AA17]